MAGIRRSHSDRITTKKFRCFGFVPLLLVLAGTTGVHAQTTTTGAIIGRVTDQSGAVVPNASVTLIQLSTGAKRSATSDDIGVYRFSLLPPGSYAATFSATG